MQLYNGPHLNSSHLLQLRLTQHLNLTTSIYISQYRLSHIPIDRLITSIGIMFANAIANVAFINDNKAVNLSSNLVSLWWIASSALLTFGIYFSIYSGRTPHRHCWISYSHSRKRSQRKIQLLPPTIKYSAISDSSVVLTHAAQNQSDISAT